MADTLACVCRLFCCFARTSGSFRLLLILRGTSEQPDHIGESDRSRMEIMLGLRIGQPAVDRGAHQKQRVTHGDGAVAVQVAHADVFAVVVSRTLPVFFDGV